MKLLINGAHTLRRFARISSNIHFSQHALPSSLITRDFAITRRGSKTIKKSGPPPPKQEVVPVEEAWVSVRDESSGKIYWWNQQTNETTALDAPKPTGATAQSQAAVQTVYVAHVPANQVASGGGGMLSGLGGVMAQGMAFGAGSSMAHHAIGSMFGGGSSSHSHDSSSSSSSSSSSDFGDSDGGDWDI